MKPLLVAWLLVLNAPWIGLQAEEEPRWSAGVVAMTNICGGGSSLGDAGAGPGVQGTWRVVHLGRLDLRLEATLGYLFRGPGAYDSAPYGNRHPHGNQALPEGQWWYTSRGTFEEVAAEFELTIWSPQAPKLIFGSGIQNFDRSSRIRLVQTAPDGTTTTTWYNHQDHTADVSLTAGIQFPLGKMGLVELRAILPFVSVIGERYGPQTDPDFKNPVLVCLSARRRF